jgi:hypothetical protein
VSLPTNKIFFRRTWLQENFSDDGGDGGDGSLVPIGPTAPLASATTP